MYSPRHIESDPAWRDEDGIKIYTISARQQAVSHAAYLPRLASVKAGKSVDWATTPAFVIFHDGASSRYLVLAWWGNDNELFTSVSVNTPDGWVEDPGRYSFCVWDLEVFWFERNGYVETILCARPDIDLYRNRRMGWPGARP